MSDPQSITFKRSHFVSLLAAGLIICFFLPWLRVIVFKASGFDLQKEGGQALLLWAMPVIALIALVAGLQGKGYQILGQLAGATPLGILLYGLYHEGAGLFQALEPAAWVALALGIGLMIAARR